MTIHRTLIKAKKLFRRGKGWCQGNYGRCVDNKMSYCAVGAIGMASRISPVKGHDTEAAAFIRRNIPNGWDLIAFNDRGTTTYADVSKLFSKAITKARRLGV